jgi:hypothetical protein
MDAPKILSAEALTAYRRGVFRLEAARRLRTPAAAVDFVNERGFIFFWPIREVLLPSLWAAVAGERPVADAHDDPGHVTWGWKDDLLGQRRWYYAKVLRKKATIIANWLAPSFYALSANYGAPEEDYLTLYEQGKLTQEAKGVYEVLLREGPLDTVALRKAARLASRATDAAFARAMTDLQADFKILPVGVTQAGAWHYAYAYDLTARHFPELPDAAHPIAEITAQRTLLAAYLRSVGAARPADVRKLFGWPLEGVMCLLEAASPDWSGPWQLEGAAGEWWAARDFAR